MFQDVEDGIRDAITSTEIEPLALLDLSPDVDGIAQDGEYMLANPPRSSGPRQTRLRVRS